MVLRIGKKTHTRAPTGPATPLLPSEASVNERARAHSLNCINFMQDELIVELPTPVKMRAHVGRGDVPYWPCPMDIHKF